VIGRGRLIVRRRSNARDRFVPVMIARAVLVMVGKLAVSMMGVLPRTLGVLAGAAVRHGMPGARRRGCRSRLPGATGHEQADHAPSSVEASSARSAHARVIASTRTIHRVSRRSLRDPNTKTHPFRLAAVLVPLCAGWCAGIGCSPSPSPRAPAATTCEHDMRWGGWDGTPECAKISHFMIPAGDLACQVDSDCVLVGRSQCGANSVARTASEKYGNHAPACGHPEAGQCPALAFATACRSGCCNVTLADAH
jgi:hypothetical protein